MFAGAMTISFEISFEILLVFYQKHQKKKKKRPLVGFLLLLMSGDIPGFRAQ